MIVVENRSMCECASSGMAKTRLVSGTWRCIGTRCVLVLYIISCKFGEDKITKGNGGNMNAMHAGSVNIKHECINDCIHRGFG